VTQRWFRLGIDSLKDFTFNINWEPMDCEPSIGSLLLSVAALTNTPMHQIRVTAEQNGEHLFHVLTSPQWPKSLLFNLKDAPDTELVEVDYPYYWEQRGLFADGGKGPWEIINAESSFHGLVVWLATCLGCSITEINLEPTGEYGTVSFRNDLEFHRKRYVEFAPANDADTESLNLEVMLNE